MRKHSTMLALLAGSAFVFIGASASAQDYGYDRDDAYRSAPENFEVTVPRPGPQRDRMGAPYTNRSLSQEVRFDDLDLRTGHGARILRERVKLTARMLCRELDERYPVTADNSPPCYNDAAEDALYRANRAIHDARNYND